MRIVRTLRAGWPVLPVLFLAGCASDLQLRAGDPRVGNCLEAYRMIDRAVMEAGVGDAEVSRIAGFPHLRTNRFLASFAGRDLSAAAAEAWVRRLAALDRDARTIELMNLPADRRRTLDARLRQLDPSWSAAEPAHKACASRLTSASLVDRTTRDSLRDAVAVPDDYSVLARTLGLYPLTAVPVALGYQRWRSINLPAFERPLDESMNDRPTGLYQPETGRPVVEVQQVKGLLEAAARADPLDIPALAGDDLRAVAEAFAPVLVVEARGEADRIGHPVWRTDGLPAVDPERPVAFFRLEHAWFEGRPIAQLVYLFWFDERPAERMIDLLAGRLDGLIWRVSLGRDGRPIVYDTIHACGCYHLFFPAPGTALEDLPENHPTDPRDPILVPLRAELLAPDQRVVVRIASGSHYVTGVGPLDRLDHSRRAVTDYELVIEDPADLSLRSMPEPRGGRRSLYRPDAIVEGTERGERVLLWPMGIKEPGAMRQWGRHATAFVGERHFDDPDLIERAFAR